MWRALRWASGFLLSRVPVALSFLVLSLYLRMWKWIDVGILDSSSIARQKPTTWRGFGLGRWHGCLIVSIILKGIYSFSVGPSRRRPNAGTDSVIPQVGGWVRAGVPEREAGWRPEHFGFHWLSVRCRRLAYIWPIKRPDVAQQWQQMTR